MMEIIQAARSIIPVAELTFLSLHKYLYSKGTALVVIFSFYKYILTNF